MVIINVTTKHESCNMCERIIATGKEYCEVCSPHGFSYWVNAKRTGDKIFWLIVVLICFAGSCGFVKIAVEDWIENPTITTINTLYHPITKLNHPAITICKPNGIYDAGEYIRAVFNNFQYSCESDLKSESCQATMELRRHYAGYSELTNRELNKIIETSSKVS